MGLNDRSIIVGSLRPDLIKSREADHTKHTLFHAQKNMIKVIYAFGSYFRAGHFTFSQFYHPLGLLSAI